MCIIYTTNVLIKKLKINNIKQKNLVVLIVGLLVYALLYYILNKLNKKDIISKKTLKISLLVFMIIDVIPIAIFLYKNEYLKRNINPVIRKPSVSSEKYTNNKHEVLQLTNNSVTKGTTNINSALGNAFNTKGQSNNIDIPSIPVVQPEKSVTNIDYNELPSENIVNETPFITPKVTKPPDPTEYVTIGGAKDEINNGNNANNNGFNSDNILSIDDVLTVDKNLKSTDYKTTKIRTHKNKPILVDPNILKMIKNQHNIPEYSEFTTTSHISCIKSNKSFKN